MNTTKEIKLSTQLKKFKYNILGEFQNNLKLKQVKLDIIKLHFRRGQVIKKALITAL
jgi:hypothetical protein